MDTKPDPEQHPDTALWKGNSMAHVKARTWLVFAGLLFVAGHGDAAPSNNPQILHQFCHPSHHCTDQQDEFGSGAYGPVAGSDGAYYGATAGSSTIRDANGNGDAGGSIYRVDPATRDVSVIYQFPRGYYPTSWLETDPDGSLFGGYRHAENANADWISEGFYRLTTAGEFTIVLDQTTYQGFSCNAPVHDASGNLIGITNSMIPGVPNIIYKIGADGMISVVHALPANQYFSCPNHQPVLAADGNLYGIMTGNSNAPGTINAIYRLAADGAFTILHEFQQGTQGFPTTPLTIGPDGALYGILSYRQPTWPPVSPNSLYRVSLDGQFTNSAPFGPVNFSTRQKLVLMPDGYFYGSGGFSNSSTQILFRLSPAAEFTTLFGDRNAAQNSSFSPVIRGFDGALYGASFYDGKYGGGLLFRYKPPTADTRKGEAP